MGSPKILIPALLNGNGCIKFSENVQLGVVNSPYFYSHYSYFEVRTENAEICIGANTSINNNATIVAEKSKITIGNNVLIGVNCHIYDSDFHSLNVEERTSDSHICKEVIIMDNVFIGNNVTILKGSIVGENSVIAAGSIVNGTFPNNVVLGGIPAKIVKKINV